MTSAVSVAGQEEAASYACDPDGQRVLRAVDIGDEA